MKKILKVLPVMFFMHFFGQNIQCNIHLDSLDIGMNVNSFFIDKIIKHDSLEYYDENETLINSVQAFTKYGETYYTRKSSLTEYDLEKEFYSEEDKNIIIGNLYSINRYAESDRLACYLNISFPTLSILSTTNDKFVGLIAENSFINEPDFNLLIENLQKTNNLQKLITTNFEIFQFDFNSYVIEFKKGRDSYGKIYTITFEDDNEEEIEKIYIEFVIRSKLADNKQLEWLNTNNDK